MNGLIYFINVSTSATVSILQLQV